MHFARFDVGKFLDLPVFTLLLVLVVLGIPAGGQPGPDQISTTPVLAEAPTSCPSLELPATEAWRAVQGSIAVRDR